MSKSKPIFSKLEAESILHDITPRIIMTTTSMPCLVSRLSQQTVDILLSLKSPKKIVEFMKRQSEAEGLLTVYFMVFFVKPDHAKRGVRSFLFLNSLKELSLYTIAIGNEEKYGTVESFDVNKKHQKLIFRQENGNELIFKIKSNTISENLYSAIDDFFNDYSRPYQDFLTSFMHLPMEQVEMFLPLKESFRRMVISTDLDFITKTSQLELNDNQMNEFGQIIYTLYSNYECLLYATFRLVYITVAATESPDDLFNTKTVFAGLMHKWINTSRFDFYQNTASMLQKLYREIFTNEDDVNNNDKKNVFFEKFLNELKLSKSFPEDLMAVARRIFIEVKKKFPDNEDAPYFSLTRVFVEKGLEDIIGDKPEFLMIKNLLEIKSNDNNDDSFNSIVEKLKFSLREIAVCKNKELAMPKINEQEKNLNYLGLLRFIFKNAESLCNQLNDPDFHQIPQQIKIFLSDLLDLLKNSNQI